MGNVIGIVAEYNPFHNGHARLIEQTRARLGADCPVVCVMSGDFVQRGSPAVYAKFARAEAAARCGADLVLELPLPWAIASAEGFAAGGVGVLAATGAVEVDVSVVQLSLEDEKALNLALNLLGCYVHDLRLQCLEYFGKFYEDGGKPFKPLMADTKYVDITK